MDYTADIKAMVAGAIAGNKAIQQGKSPSQVKKAQLAAEDRARKGGK